VALEKVEGVEAVEVSLNEGLARIRLRPENRVEFERIARLVEEKGFTPRQAEVRVAGRLEGSKGSWRLRVTPGEEVFDLEVPGETLKTEAESAWRTGRALSIRGTIQSPPQARPGRRPRVLRVGEWKNYTP
jgi:hypothetical protein